MQEAEIVKPEDEVDEILKRPLNSLSQCWLHRINWSWMSQCWVETDKALSLAKYCCIMTNSGTLCLIQVSGSGRRSLQRRRLPQTQVKPRCWRQTDRQTDGQTDRWTDIVVA